MGGTLFGNIKNFLFLLFCFNILGDTHKAYSIFLNMFAGRKVHYSLSLFGEKLDAFKIWKDVSRLGS